MENRKIISFPSQKEQSEKLKKTCEKNLKSIIEKYRIKEKLIDEDYYLVSGYIFYSNPNISNGINENISPLARKMVDMYGSGNFNDAELKVLQKIHEEGKNIIEKESPKRR